jgi:hypothetical protein
MAKVKTWADEAAKARKELDTENGYYTAFSKDGVCVECIHFSINHDHPSLGVYNKMMQSFQDQEFAKKGVEDDVVSTHGFCENYTNIHGIGVEGKIIMPQLLPPMQKPARTKKQASFLSYSVPAGAGRHALLPGLPFTLAHIGREYHARGKCDTGAISFSGFGAFRQP